MADASVWATSSLGVAVWHVFCVCVCVFPLPVMLPSEIPKLPTDPPMRGFPGVWKLSLLHNSSLGWVSVPNSFVSLFVFYILSYLLLIKMGWLSGCLVSSASIQKLFCGSCSAFKYLLMNWWGRKWSPCPIPLPSWDHPFLLAILIPVCASSSPGFLMMYSEYKLNKQGDKIQP